MTYTPYSTDDKQRARARLRNLTPVSPQVCTLVRGLTHPLAWGIGLIVTLYLQRGLWQGPPTQLAVAAGALACVTAACFYLQNLLKEEWLTTPPETADDPDLQRAIDRLMRPGGRVLRAHRNVIDDYMRVIHGCRR